MFKHEESSLQDSHFGVIVGGWNNLLDTDAWGSVIGGGDTNTVHSPLSVIGGGWNNKIFDRWAYDGVIVGGHNNQMHNGVDAFIGGGRFNRSFAGWTALAGGDSNTITGGGDHAAIPGGIGLIAQSYAQFVAGRFNVPQGTSTPGSINPTDVLVGFGNGIAGSPSNAVTISNDGLLSVYGTAGVTTKIGTLSANNSTVAWGNVVGGIMVAGIGCTVGPAGPVGVYTITLHVNEQDGITPHTFTANKAALVATPSLTLAGGPAMVTVGALVVPGNTFTLKTFDWATGLPVAGIDFQFHVVTQ
jgi:hypothetical protein